MTFILSFFYKDWWIDWFLAVLGLSRCVKAFSSCGKWGLLFTAVCGLLAAVPSLVAERGLQALRSTAVAALGPWSMSSVAVAYRLSCGVQVGWHHQLNGHEFEQAPGVGDRQGSMVCCSPWGHRLSDMTKRLNWQAWLLPRCGSSQTRDRIDVPCIGKQIQSLNHQPSFLTSLTRLGVTGPYLPPQLHFTFLVPVILPHFNSLTAGCFSLWGCSQFSSFYPEGSCFLLYLKYLLLLQIFT